MKKPLFLFPPVYLALFILAQWGLAEYFPIEAFELSAWSFWLGIGIVAVTFLVVLQINFQFKHHDTSIIPYKESDALLEKGHFAYSRNPIYLMMTFCLFGTGLMFAALSSILLVILFPLLINWRFIQTEERMLEEKFGEKFKEYKERVRRWL